MEVPTRIEQILTPRVRFSLSEEEDVDLKLKFDKGLRSYARSLGFVSSGCGKYACANSFLV